MSASPALKESLVLLKSAQDGDRGAYEAFMARYFERVLRIVRARIGPKLRTRQDSMDIAQDAMIRVIQGLDQFEPQSEGALIHWISKLVENQIRDAADFHGAQKRRISREVPLTTDSDEGPGLLGRVQDPTQKTPSQILVLQEDLQKLEDTLDDLGSGKEVILLRDYAGMTFKEIGKELGLSEDAARMQYVRAMDKLTDALANQDAGEHP